MNNAIENQLQQIRKRYKKIKEFNPNNLIIKILLLIVLLLNLTKEIKKSHNILPKEAKNKIISIGFFDIIYCDRRWRRVKKGYFYDLPKYTKKLRWIFLAKNGVD